MCDDHMVALSHHRMVRVLFVRLLHIVQELKSLKRCSRPDGDKMNSTSFKPADSVAHTGPFIFCAVEAACALFMCQDMD